MPGPLWLRRHHRASGLRAGPAGHRGCWPRPRVSTPCCRVTTRHDPESGDPVPVGAHIRWAGWCLAGRARRSREGRDFPLIRSTASNWRTRRRRRSPSSGGDERGRQPAQRRSEAHQL